MQGVLYVSHGTRLKAGEEEAIDFLTSIQHSIDAQLQEICFLEICAPSIEEGVKRLVDRGATAIAVVPILLLSAGHDKHDIPEELAKVTQQYPEIVFRYGAPLGVQERLVHVLVERIHATAADIAKYESILLVGRGSHMLSVQQDIEAIATMLSEKVDKPVDVAYLAACKPAFTEKLDQLGTEQKKKVIVAPYLLFDGLLFQSMIKKVEQYNQDNSAQLLLSHCLGEHEMVKQAFIQRVNQALG
ncbi:sirohydrochlorin chelatase [Aquibacillus salsiterrae]|uniref:Sirohydrochlorin chelatase n=1 Tax=Aquibacillus salsiterrae TaxID=2950439 RepID=A0A9X3WHL4_9BACI|nr:sirohydrochlorin chelatase [Aquibacillus salsiterrae]MDC3417599.1 sirohydrochlorin chelatase [Aquibacillus salsiterrae]